MVKRMTKEENKKMIIKRYGVAAYDAGKEMNAKEVKSKKKVSDG